MSGAHEIHVHIDARSPRWSTGNYRFEQHYHFTVPGENDVQWALARMAALCEELRNPPRDKPAPPDVPLVDQMLADMPPPETWLAIVRTSLQLTEEQLGGPSLGEENFDQRVERAMTLIKYLRENLG